MATSNEIKSQDEFYHLITRTSKTAKRNVNDKEEEQDKKESKTQNDEKLALQTEWQKRNINFLRKKAEEAEKKKRQEKLHLERTPHAKKADDEEEKDSQSEK